MEMSCFNIQLLKHSHFQLLRLFKMDSHRVPLVCLFPQWSSLLVKGVRPSGSRT
jgi:hypothetical protein